MKKILVFSFFLSFIANQAIPGCGPNDWVAASTLVINPVAVSSNAQLTGNDSRISIHPASLHPIEVNVWDDVTNGSGFSWTYDPHGTPCSNNFALPAGARFPDVAVVE